MNTQIKLIPNTIETKQNHPTFFSNLAERIQYFLFPSRCISQIEKIISEILQNLHSSGPFALSVERADRLIQRYGSDAKVKKIMQAFDRQIRPYRLNGEYKQSDNIAALRKWQKAHQPDAIFNDFPEFAQFLESSKLLSQMKVTKDSLRIIDGEPAMLVEGAWMKASAIKSQFTIADSDEFDERFVIDTCGSVYTYLDNGKGLQKFHPFLSVGSEPVSMLNDDELTKVHQSASQFIRPQETDLTDSERELLNSKRLFTIQIVTSNTHLGDSNLSQTLRNPRHSYMRLIAGEYIESLNIKKGQVWEFGFGWKKRFPLPMMASQGRFRTPDLWEYMPVDKRFVTNIPVTSEEAANVFKYTVAFHRRNAELGREIGFHMAQQNCTVFVHEALKQAGIDIPTVASLPQLIGRIVPDILQKLGRQIAAWSKSANRFLSNALSVCTGPRISHFMILVATKVRQLFQKLVGHFTAFILTPIRAALGGLSGEGGDAFDPKLGRVEPPLRKFGNIFDFSSYRFNLPCVLQEWQKSQPSTVVYENPVRLAIVPLAH